MDGGTLKSKSSNWFKIKKAPEKCSENDLLGLISELYSLSKSNKDFLEAGFLRENQILERYKSLIKKYLAQNEPWKNGQQISIKDAQKVLNDYKKATSNKISLIDLMVYYTECGTDFYANLVICMSNIT